MKDLYIGDLKNCIGKEVSLTVLLKSCTVNENRHNNKWQEMKVSDRTGEIIIKAWAELINEKYNALVGKIVKVFGLVGYYQDAPDINIIAMEEVKDFDWSDFLQILDNKTVNKYSERLIGYIDMVENPAIKALLAKIFTEARIKKLGCAVGGKLHHNYFGGLLVHIVETCDLALHKARYRNGCGSMYAEKVNHDLVIAGALLHDIGKLNCYSGFPEGERTNRYYLVGVPVESVLFATGFNNLLAADLRIKDLGPLDHIILTAESIDYSGPSPRTIEAVIVNEANRVSVKIDGFDLAFYNSDRHSHKNKVYSSINKTMIIREV